MDPAKFQFETDDVEVYLAAAGAGKTTAIMDEMSRLLEVYRPDEIAFVTFTRKGVANGIERALQANPQLVADDLVHFRTLHALCFRELGLRHASIIEPKDMELFNKLLGFDVHLREAFEMQSEDDKLLSRYDAIRSGSTKGAYIHAAYDEFRYARLVKAYEHFKRINKLVDFYDCLQLFKEANKPVAVKVAFIDEAQDLTTLQWEVCRAAFSQCEKIRIAGDDFQSLFTYAGANPRVLVELSKRYKTVKLEKSFRLSKAVYRFTKGIVALIEDKIDKDFMPAKDVEGFVRELSTNELLAKTIAGDYKANGYSPYRWYLLFRNNCFIQTIADVLEAHLVPYHTAHSFCIPERDLARIRRYYRYQRERGGRNRTAFENFCKEYRIQDINADFTGSALVPDPIKSHVYLEYVNEHGVEALESLARKEPFLLLSTTHRVKGGEADYVAVFLDCTRKVHENVLFNLDEELRVLYVACTRARIGLYLMDATQGNLSLARVVNVVKEQIA
jgi:superfamily I DNA/RNA helicase